MVKADSDAHDLNLRQLREEALESLFVATGIAGFSLILLGLQFPQHRQIGSLGILVMLVPFLAHRLLARHYLADAWLLVGTWLVFGLALTYWLPATPAVFLLALPVALAGLFVGAGAGSLTGVSATLAAIAVAPAGDGVIPPWNEVLAATVIWGVFVLVWLSSRPLEASVRWSWRHCDQARQQLDQARDTQAELKQAVKDLADASVQMARLNDLLSAARRAAEDAERAKAEFAANVSHELRTPLNMILGFAEMIVDAPRSYGDRLPPALLADVAAIHRNSQHLASLINDVLDISQVEAQRMSLIREWNPLADVVEAAVLAVQPLFESRGLSLDVAVPASLPLVYCDRTRIRQVLLNLLNNAARFTETGGVTIEARPDEERVVVTVTDTGPGIAETDLPKLFEPFRQLDGSVRRRQGGSGLGLNISRRFVELHGGQMGVRSRLGAGSSFWFSLPLAAPSPDAASVARWLPTEWEPRRHARLASRLQLVPRLVVLEPRDVLRGAIRRYLDGVEVEAAATPASARALLATAPAQALLIRGESPEQAAAWVDEMHDAPYATPMVACALPAPGTDGGLGVAGYLTKPITRPQLLRAIEAITVPVRSILLADDDPEALQLFGRILSTSPRRYRVLQASSGPEVLELLRARRPDLLLLDLVMPGMDGFAVLAEKGRDGDLKDIPVLILSARDPSGQPIVAPSFSATRSGGLSLPDLLRCAIALSEVLAVPRPAPGPAPPAAPGA
ncbi:MAG: response regulator [Chloroflexi bacterium]|nr:response regulator [Chloroflexota bacterium]